MFTVMVKTETHCPTGELLELASVDVAEVNKMNKRRNLEETMKI
jgi:hypothetical protein